MRSKRKKETIRVFDRKRGEPQFLIGAKVFNLRSPHVEKPCEMDELFFQTAVYCGVKDTINDYHEFKSDLGKFITYSPEEWWPSRASAFAAFIAGYMQMSEEFLCEPHNGGDLLAASYRAIEAWNKPDREAMPNDLENQLVEESL